MTSLSYAFSPYQIGKEIILRPMLRVVLKKGNIEFPTGLLVDSGADYSMLRSEIVEDGFKINVSDLKKYADTSGIGGTSEVGLLNITVRITQRNFTFEEIIPFQVPLNPDNNPPLSLLGRIPFFYRYRVDFRMGYTDDPNLGKFVIYPEEHKRESKKYEKPMKIKR